MTAIEIAKRLSQLGQHKDACDAYVVALQSPDITPPERMEAACFILQYGGDYRVSITCFLKLYQEGFFQDEIYDMLMWAFYSPNEKDMKKRYEANRRLLLKYPYLFRKDFPAFSALPLRFLPFDEKGGYVPFSPSEKRFDAFVNIKKKEITRHFFRDLENPILADDVYSQYELEYLYDNVRASEYIGRENHLYLHYTDWEIFCSWLQVLDLRRLIKSDKIVFLIGEEIAQYPIDFKARFGIDYSQYPVRRVGVREVTRLIWHTQLSAHNGGDFFNEIFDYHPNLYFFTSVWFSQIMEVADSCRKTLRECANLKEAQLSLSAWNDPWLIEHLYRLKNPTDKDFLVALFMRESAKCGNVDPASRIVPALFFQPHFPNIWGEFRLHKESGLTMLNTNITETIQNAHVLKEFPYVKTFTPLRRFTTSYSATVRFKDLGLQKLLETYDGTKRIPVIEDVVTVRVLNRSFMRDPDDRLYQDSVVVRFEDSKLNPTAVFTRLAAFVDLPYTESMTYCSQNGERDPRLSDDKENAIGFDTSSVYKTYDDYSGDAERCYIEYFMRDAYQFYGYDFQYYDGKPVDEARYTDWIDHFTILDEKIKETWGRNLALFYDRSQQTDEEFKNKSDEEVKELLTAAHMKGIRKNRLTIARELQRDLRFVNQNGQPLQMMPMLQPDPALMERPLYH